MALATSAHVRVTPTTSDSIDAASRAASSRPIDASTKPSPRKAAYARLLLNASQLRSPTIDHQIVTPVHTTRRSNAQSSTAPERPIRGTGSQPNGTRDEGESEEDDGRAPHGQRPSDARAVAREHRSEQRRADESSDDEGADTGGPDRGLRRRIHDGPR